jgi:hypothetical protein
MVGIGPSRRAQCAQRLRNRCAIFGSDGNLRGESQKSQAKRRSAERLLQKRLGQHARAGPLSALQIPRINK